MHTNLAGNEDSPTYQNIVLKDFKSSETKVLEDFRTTMAAIADDFAERCRKFNEHPVFKHLVTILDTRKWPTGESLSKFGDSEMRELADHFKGFLAGDSEKVKPILRNHDIDLWSSPTNEYLFFYTWPKPC